MATNFPGSLDSSTQQPTIASSDEMDDSGKEHDVVHTNHSGAIIALETKLGTGDSNAVADAVLMGTGSGTSAWDTSPTFKGAVTVGVDDTGHDVKFFGATSGKYMEWDESEDQLNISGSVRLTLHDSANYDATTLLCGNNTDTTPDANWNGHFVVDGNGYTGGISLDGDAMWVGHNSSLRDLYLATDETARLKIAPTGEVTLPNVPAFRAYKSGTSTVTTTGAAIWVCDTEIFDNGGDFNTTDGKFYAPVDGYYFFTMHWFMYTTYSNDTDTYFGFVATGDNAWFNHGTEGEDGGQSISALFHLDEGDVCYPWIATPSKTITAYTSAKYNAFNGYLVG